MTTQQSQYTELQTNIATASSLHQSSAATRQAIYEKIQLLEDKLSNAENLLGQLKQPLKLSADTGGTVIVIFILKYILLALM